MMKGIKNMSIVEINAIAAHSAHILPKISLIIFIFNVATSRWGPNHFLRGTRLFLKKAGSRKSRCMPRKGMDAPLSAQDVLFHQSVPAFAAHIYPKAGTPHDVFPMKSYLLLSR